MSPFFNTLLSSLPHRLPVPRSYLYLSSFPFRPYPLSPLLLHLDRYRFILVVRIPTPGLPMTRILWRPPPRHRSCHQPLILPFPFEKVLVPLVIPILFILSCLIIIYPYHILLLFPPCLLFLFLTLYMRPSLIQAGRRQWLETWPWAWHVVAAIDEKSHAWRRVIHWLSTGLLPACRSSDDEPNGGVVGKVHQRVFSTL